MDSEETDWRRDVVLARPADIAPGSWMLVDLRALGAEGLSSAPAKWRDLALGYDIALLAPILNATSVLGSEATTAP